MSVWSKVKKVGSAGLGLATGGLAGDERFGLMDNIAYRDYGKLWEDVTGQTAADKAAEAQLSALDKGQASMERMFDKSMETQRPWLEAGGRGLSQLESGIDSGRFDVQPREFQYDDYQGPGEFQFDFEADPGYQFRLNQGMKALEGSAAARGGLFSTQTGDRIQDYAQGLASQEYGQAYNRARGAYESDRAFGRDVYTGDRGFEYGDLMDDFNRERATKTDQYNRLASLAGVGQTTAGNVGSQQMMQGGNLANIAQQRGNVGAQQAMAGYQGTMNLLNTGLQGLGAIAPFLSGSPKK